MMVNHTFLSCRVGGGIRSSVFVKGTAKMAGGFNVDPVAIVIELVELYQSEGNSNKLRKRLDALTPELDANRMTGPNSGFDCAVDITAAPTFDRMVPSIDGYYIINTGLGWHRDGIKERLGRLELLDNLKGILSRGLVKFEQDDNWPDVQAALIECTGKPPKNEQDGLALLETTQADDITLAIALMVWRVMNNPPLSSGTIDYSAIDKANGLC